MHMSCIYYARATVGIRTNSDQDHWHTVQYRDALHLFVPMVRLSRTLGYKVGGATERRGVREWVLCTCGVCVVCISLNAHD